MNLFVKSITSTAILLSLAGCTAITDFTSSTSSTVDAVTPDITVNEFVNKRFIAIRKEAATGGGENLNALAQLLGKSDNLEFAKYMKMNFDKIFTGVKSPEDIITKIETDTASRNS